VTVISDAAARMNALVTGAVQVINKVDSKAARLLGSSGQTTVVVSPGKNHMTMAMDSTKAPFTDNNVRLALKHAIDREHVLSLAFAGYGTIGNDHPVPKSDPFHHSELPQRSYDPEKAKWYLSEAGLDNLAVELFTSSAAGVQAVDTAQVFAESVKKVDELDLSVNRAPSDGYWSNTWMKELFFMSYWTARATADMMLIYAYTSTAKYNESRFASAKLDQILDTARSEPDFEKRKRLYWDAQELLNQSGSSIVYAFADCIDAHGPAVGGFVPDGARETGGGRAIERLWLKG